MIGAIESTAPCQRYPWDTKDGSLKFYGLQMTVKKSRYKFTYLLQTIIVGITMNTQINSIKANAMTR